MIFVDKKYINMVSPYLELFKWKRDNLACMRCPICGDSEKNKTKTRGYFYVKNGEFFYRCHNCNYGSNLYHFLEHINPSIAKDYVVEKFAERNVNKVRDTDLSNITFEQPFKPRKLLEFATSLVDLDEDHACIHYVKSRQIPYEKYRELYYTDMFDEFAATLDSSSNLVPSSRLIIPVYNESGNLIAVQGRSLYNEKPKYITIKANGHDQSILYGMDKVNRYKKVYVTEGPIDSMFLPNAIAMMGSNCNDLVNEFQQAVIVYDNEPRNFHIVREMRNAIMRGFEVCIWPDSVKEKDINEMIMTKTIEEVIDCIDNNTYNGLCATLRLNDWKRV